MSARLRADPASAAPARAGADEHRQRLIDAMGALLASRSHHLITIAEIVAQARVSKRTFYEQFETKEDCLVALCEHIADQALAVIAAAYDPDLPWEEQLAGVTGSYLRFLQNEPALIRALVIDLLVIGPRGLAVRRRIFERFAQFLVMQVELARRKLPGKRALTPELAQAIVGGLNELVLRAVERNEVHRLDELAQPACELMHAVFRHLEAPPQAG